MCTVMAGIAAVSGLMQMQANRQQAKAQSAYYSAMAEQNTQNAKIAENQRSQIADRYYQQQKQLDDRRRLIAGQHAASAGASGLTSDGSVLDADSAAYDQWKDASMNLLWNQRVDTHDAWINQANYINQANANRTAAANARSQGRMANLATLIGTATSVYSGLKNYGTVKNTKAATGSGMLHHQAAISGMPETMEDQVYAMTRYKPQTIISRKGPYDWLK